MRRAKNYGFTLIELLVVISIIAILIGLTLAGVQKVRAASARTVCQNQIRQVALALHHFHDSNHQFPSGVSYFGGKSPQPHMTWLTRILPYVEQEVLWKQSLIAFEQDKFFETPPHLPILGQKISLFVCPTDDIGQTPWNYGRFAVAYTSYLGVSGLNLNSWDGVLHTDSTVAIKGIIDGTSNTLLFGERFVNDNHNLGWWYAGWGQSKTGSTDSILGVRELKVDIDLDSCPKAPSQFKQGHANNRCDVLHFWSNHTNGAHFAFADGSVRFLNYSANDIMPALSTRAGGEVVSIPE